MAENKELPIDSNSLAIERTVLAHERTLMAWVRTSTSLISFGFTMYKFFQYLVEQGQVILREQRISPRHYGMIMILLGIFGLLFATIQHRFDLKRLKKVYPNMPRSLSEIVAVLLLGLGFFLLLAVVFKE